MLWTNDMQAIIDFYQNMREFAILDNNGYILQFVKEIS